MTEFTKEAADLLRAFATWGSRPGWLHEVVGPPARAYLESLKREEDREQMLRGTHEWGNAIAEANKPEAPKERTCEEMIQFNLGCNNPDQCESCRSNCEEALRLHRSEVASLKAERDDAEATGVALVHEKNAIRDERDELARRIEKAKHELGDRYGWIHAILEGRNK